MVYAWVPWIFHVSTNFEETDKTYPNKHLQWTKGALLENPLMASSLLGCFSVICAFLWFSFDGIFKRAGQELTFGYKALSMDIMECSSVACIIKKKEVKNYINALFGGQMIISMGLLCYKEL